MTDLAEPPTMNEPKSKPVRVRPDLHTMLKVIEAAAELEGKPFNTIEFIDKHLRGPVTTEYRKAKAVIAKVDPHAAG